MKAKEADLFDTLEDQVKAMYDEIGLLSKKKPDGPVNKFKLKLINDVLKKVNELMGEEYMPFGDFNSFDEDALPTASDVVFILSQYMKSMDKFRYQNTEIIAGVCSWCVPGDAPGPVTRRPHRRV